MNTKIIIIIGNINCMLIVFTGCQSSSAYRSEDRGGIFIRIKGYNFKWGKMK